MIKQEARELLKNVCGVEFEKLTLETFRKLPLY